MDPLPGGRSHTFSPTPLVPVSVKSLSFSISAILGLEEDLKRQDLPKNERNTQSPELRVHNASPRHSYSDAGPQSYPFSDNTSSTVSCNSDQVSLHAEQPAKKKRKRTTFSPIEVWELERAYRRRPYLMNEDEEELVQRLGISARSLKHWFQNRRAKSRKEEAHSVSIGNTNPSSQFGPPVSRLRKESWKPLRPQLPVSHARDLKHEFLTVQSNRSDQLYRTSPTSVNHPSAFKSTQFRRCRSFQLPMFHPDLFKFPPVAKKEKLPHRPEFYTSRIQADTSRIINRNSHTT